MTLLQAVAIFTGALISSATLGMVTSRFTAHWIRIDYRNRDAVTALGALVGAIGVVFFWGPVLDNYYRVHVGMGYMSILWVLTVLVFGCTAAFLMIAFDSLMRIVKAICARIDRMFIKTF